MHNLVPSMLNVNSIMIGSHQPKVMIDFYGKVFDKTPDMSEEDWAGWQMGACFFGVGPHSDMKDASSEPGRIMINMETKEIIEEFERIKGLGAEVVKEPYEVGQGMKIATFADPDNNYFQLMTPWSGDK